MAQTLDQQRAALAWGYATTAMKTDLSKKTDFAKKYRNLSKGAPALIMNSGLMPTLAFYNSKDVKKDPQHQALLNDLLAGLTIRLKPSPPPKNFQDFMGYLQKCKSHEYLQMTDEALELLKWLRQFVDAVETQGA